MSSASFALFLRGRDFALWATPESIVSGGVRAKTSIDIERPCRAVERALFCPLIEIREEPRACLVRTQETERPHTKLLLGLGPLLPPPLKDVPDEVVPRPRIEKVAKFRD